MSLHVTQYTLHRAGRSAHWIGVMVACPHGRAECEATIPAADRLPATTLARVTTEAVHHLIHHVMRHHRRATGCRCASTLGIFCWPSTYFISRDSLSTGGSHVAAS